MSESSYIDPRFYGQSPHRNIYDTTIIAHSANANLSSYQASPPTHPVYNATHSSAYGQYDGYNAETTQYSYATVMDSSHVFNHAPQDDAGQLALDHNGAHAPLELQDPDSHYSTNGRRRAQNRAAQRAFRERKEKHTKNLETQLAELTQKYRNLEMAHLELRIAYEKLQKSMEILTEAEAGRTGSETLRRCFDAVYGHPTSQGHTAETIRGTTDRR